MSSSEKKHVGMRILTCIIIMAVSAFAIHLNAMLGLFLAMGLGIAWSEAD